MNAASLPAEIWLTVFEYAMFVGSIFSTDLAADSIENPYAIHYWLQLPAAGDIVLQQWAIIRQVCRFWQSLVDHPQIRYRFFVDVPDVITQEALLKAQRIQGSSLWSPTLTKTIRRAYHESSVMERILSSLPKDAISHASIITDVDDKLGQLIAGLIRTEFFPALCSNLPFLTFLSLHSTHSFRMPPEVSLQMGSLRALEFSTPMNILGRPSFNQWSLPCLRHMKIGNIVDVSDFNRFLKALPLFGGKLEYLHITVRRWDGDENEFSDIEGKSVTELWDHCPNLQRLHIPLHLVINYKPPSHHPLRYLTNSDRSSQYASLLATSENPPGDLKDTTIAFCQAVPHLVALRDSHDWTSVESHTMIPGATEGENAVTEREREVCRLMVETVVQMRTLGMTVRVEDKYGNSWEEVSDKD
ncbi:hypothetical protein M408DRAFT_9978 [Serendipita vermifera MAFF 305830]|uniref:F-box domain-containing protein n=1 Tax=Serendipita vermifera MAFF 305830 TaxID=933852 RepID=A0A0C2WJ13_SERVB|nr:hypothetical protein M408DRAFT_9978 [Serendipita vermifera MAFF 305830]